MMKLNQLCTRLKGGSSYFCEANIHIAASGSNTSPYDTWAKAANSATTALADAITASNAGDDFYCDAAFVLSNSSAQTYTFKGTAAAPNRFFSCSTITNDAPTTADLGRGATFTTTGASGQTVRGVVYIKGANFNVGTGTTAAGFTTASANGNDVTLDDCQINMLVTVASVGVNIGAAGVNSKTTLINTPITWNGGTASTINFNGGIFIWKFTPSAVQGSQTAIANLITPAGAEAGVIIIQGVDFSGGTGIASGKNVIAATNSPYVVQAVACPMKAGAVFAARPTTPMAVIDTIIVDSGTTNYKQGRTTYAGDSSASITIYNNADSGSATPADSSNRYSLQIITTANAKPQSPFECVGIPIWVAAGTYANCKVFLTSATAALKTNDVWVEAMYLGASYPLGNQATTFGAGSGSAILPQIPAGTTPGTLAAASPAWGTGGLGNDYQLAVPSFTTSADGYVHFFIKVGKASLTLNVDPAITVAA